MKEKKCTKKEIVDCIKKKSNLSRFEILMIISMMHQDIINALKSGKKIELRGFGSFDIRMKKGRSTTQRPKTGEKISAPHYSIVSFKPGKDLKERSWQLRQDYLSPDNENR